MGPRLSRVTAARVGGSRGSMDSHEGDIQAGCCNADPITAEGQRTQMLQIMLIPLLPITVLIILTFVSMIQAIEEKSLLAVVDLEIRDIESIGNFLESLESERSVLLDVLSETTSNTSVLRKQYRTTDAVLAAMSTWPPGSTYNGVSFPSRKAAAQHLISLRNISLDKGNASMLVDGYAVLGSAVLSGMSLLKTSYDELEGSIWKVLTAYEMIIGAEDFLTQQRDLGWQYLQTSFLNDEDFDSFIYNDALATDAFSVVFQMAPSTYDIYKNGTSTLLDNIATLKDFINNNKVFTNTNQEQQIRRAWYGNLTLYLKVTENIAQHILNLIETAKAERSSTINGELATAVIILLFVLAMAPVVFLIIYRITKTVQLYAKSLSAKNKELRQEKKKADTLLYQMLPKSVALQLKMSRKVLAETYSAVTIFFSDIVGFTTISARSTPLEVVDFLNGLYFLFDSTIDRYDVYKVETIGDAYMVASGCPQRNGSRHAGEIASLSMDLVEGIRHFKVSHLPSEKLRMRVGLHTGSVVAGVVGSKMPRYCLFGETVNTAAKMESNGVQMKIHISLECKQALDVIGGYITEVRGVVDIPGKGEVTTYFLKGRLASAQRGVSSRMSVRRPSPGPKTSIR